MMKNITDSQHFCLSRCSNLVSIHSANENRFIQSIYDTNFTNIAIGGFASSKDYMIWMDGSPTDYNNIQFSYAGSCVIMAAGTTDTGYWYTRPCNETFWFVCDRPAGFSC